MKYYQAQETFVTELANGSPWRVSRGDVFPETHELVKRDEGRDYLFRPLDTGETEAPKSAPKAPAKAAVRPAAEKPAGRAH